MSTMPRHSKPQRGDILIILRETSLLAKLAHLFQSVTGRNIDTGKSRRSLVF
jgi:hypothetical protein